MAHEICTDERDSKRIFANFMTEDGKEIAIDLENMKIKDVMEEVDRHSRMLARKEDLNG